MRWIVRYSSCTGSEVLTTAPPHCTYVHGERRAIAAELASDCALADLGLLDPRPLLRLLRDGQATADSALILLRLIWPDRWLRRR